jgi:hypothetical protein
MPIKKICEIPQLINNALKKQYFHDRHSDTLKRAKFRKSDTDVSTKRPDGHFFPIGKF